jgi:hypothetical protein
MDCLHQFWMVCVSFVFGDQSINGWTDADDSSMMIDDNGCWALTLHL